MEHDDKRVANLWLADELWQLDAIQFGDFSLGTAVHSPVYINLRLLISNPAALREAAEVMFEEVRTLQNMRHPHLAHYDLVAGVPFGGLHLATAFSLLSGTPMIYLHPSRDGKNQVIEGTYSSGANRPDHRRSYYRGAQCRPDCGTFDRRESDCGGRPGVTRPPARRADAPQT